MNADQTPGRPIRGWFSPRRSIRHQLLIGVLVAALGGGAASMAAYWAASALGIAFQRVPVADYEAGQEQIATSGRAIATLVSARSKAGAEAEIQALLDLFSSPSLDQPLQMWLIDANGAVLFRSHGAALAPGPVQPLRPGRDHTVSIPVQVGPGGGQLVVRGVPAPRTVYREEWSPLGATVGTGVFLLLFYLLAGAKLRYFREMAAGLKEVANGRLTHRVPVRGHDELASLAASINQTAEGLQQTREAERAAAQAQRELITNLSHDLRTPLTSLKAYLHLLESRSYRTEAEQAAYTQTAYTKAEQLQSMVEDLFAYTRLSGGEVQLKRQTTCLGTLLTQLVAENEPLAASRGMTLRCHVPESPVQVPADPEQLVRVLDNLLSNALKYGLSPGEIQLTVREEAGGARIEVANPAPPVPDETLARLFDRLYRMDAARSAVIPGSGLGLAIARSIVELHGGRIWAESGKGALRFHIWLPQ